MNWQDIDPETRDLSTPELWDAWRERVRHADVNFNSLMDGDMEVFFFVNEKCIELMWRSDDDSKGEKDIKYLRPDGLSMVDPRLTDALARIERLEVIVGLLDMRLKAR